MKAKEVLRLLRISRQTLTKYVKDGLIEVETLPNGRYEYNEKSVYKFLNKDLKRKTYIYARVSTSKQKRDLENQIELLKQFCFTNGYVISGIYSDIASGINFEKRNDFFKMIDEIIDNKVERVVITYKDRLSRVGFDLFTTYLRNIIVNMKLYSKRKIQKIKEVLSDDERNDNSDKSRKAYY